MYLLFFISFGYFRQQRLGEMIPRKRVMKSEMEMETAVAGGQLLLCLLWGELFSRCSRAKAETGRAEGEIEQKDVSNWTFSSLSAGLRLGFNGLHTSDVFGSRKAISQDTMGKHGARWHGTTRTMASGHEKKSIEWKPRPAYPIIWRWLCPHT